VNPKERGAALLLVLVALSAVIPLVAALSDLVMMRHRQATTFRENLVGQAAVRGALEVVVARLTSGQIALGPDQDERFELKEPGSRAIRVRVSREPDAVLTLEGTVLRVEEVAENGGERSGIDDEARVVGEYRRLEVYLVEAECAARNPFPTVRLLAVLGRLDGGGLVSLGIRYDRG
jgi:hypothetical protein